MNLPDNPPVKTFRHKDAAALADVLEDYEIGLRFNLRASRVEALQRSPNGSGKWRPFNDRSEAWLRGDIARGYRYQLAAGGTARLHYGAEMWMDSLHELTALNEVDPFIEWLEQLPFWDGESRIDTLLIDLFGAEDSPICRWASRFLTLGAVQRAHEPGCRLREIPVLYAEQDAGKSALLRSLLPNGTDYDEWFSDSLEFDGSTKERLRGNVGFGSAGVGWVHHVTRSARAAKLCGLVNPWAVRRRTWRRLLDASMCVKCLLGGVGGGGRAGGRCSV